MKRRASWVIAIVALAYIAGGTQAFAQDIFKISFPFQIGGTKLAKGDYSIVQKDKAHIFLKQESSGEEIPIPFTNRLPQPTPPVSEPHLVFHAVGNFAPSYTEYVTDYLLAEVWPQDSEGFLVHVTKGAHKTETIKSHKAK